MPFSAHEPIERQCPWCLTGKGEPHRDFCRNAPELKPSNPKDAVGVKKAAMSYVSAPVLLELGLAMMEGGMKYGKHNYRVIGVRASVYYDAAMRHLMAWWEGEDVDPDSGLSHLTKAIASLVVARDAMIMGKFNDDRPPKAPTGWINELNKHVEKLMQRHPNPKQPHTQIDMVDADEGC